MCAPFDWPEDNRNGQAVFFVYQANTIMHHYLVKAEHHATQLLTTEVKEVLTNKTDLASVWVDSKEEDGSDESGAEELSKEDDNDDSEDDAVRLSSFYIYYILRSPCLT